MNFLVFIIVYPIIWFLSILPMRVLYVFSDLIYGILYYIIGYRKKVVRHNLQLCFPEKTSQELLEIEKKSFHHFIDIFMEMIKSFTISKNQISKRFIFHNAEVINDFYKKHKSVIIMGGHYANWEWATLYLPQIIDHDGYGAFKKIKNKYFDNKIKQSRNRFGAILVATKDFIKLMTKHAKDKHLAVYGLLSDQSPKLSKTHYWRKFMGVEVPVQTGPEMLSKKFDIPVIYLQTERVKRGYYEAKVKILAEDPKAFKNYQITDLFTEELEKQIRKNPEFYFWTHKRFKHMKAKSS
ncbi:MAG: lipid A biosynthesis acyltransferase [Flavobacteriaceae bacterium]|nr:lipid A biosynthesis acyltransferase [Flavobacteriaceae bacterium]